MDNATGLGCRNLSQHYLRVRRLQAFEDGLTWTNILSIKKDHLVTLTKMIANHMIKRTCYGELNADGAYLWLKGYQISKK